MNHPGNFSKRNIFIQLSPFSSPPNFALDSYLIGLVRQDLETALLQVLGNDVVDMLGTPLCEDCCEESVDYMGLKQIGTHTHTHTYSAQCLVPQGSCPSYNQHGVESKMT